MPKGISKNPEITKMKLREKRLGVNNPFYGKKHSIESLEKIRNASLGNKYNLGFKHSEETRKKMSLSHKGLNSWSKGRKPSEETRIKISLALKGRNVTLKTRKKMSIAFTGRKMPQSMKDKISKIHKGKTISEEQKKEHGHFMKENPPSIETINKLVSNNKNRSGEKHHNWKGGRSKDKKFMNKVYALSHRKRRNIKLEIGGHHTEEQWESLKRLANFTCLCCKRFEPEIILHRDHIVPINKLGSDDITNIQPLCKSCNSHKHTKIIKYE